MSKVNVETQRKLYQQHIGKILQTNETFGRFLQIFIYENSSAGYPTYFSST